MTKQAIIYTRFSPRPNAKECDSLEKQADRCREFCERMGYTAGVPYGDEAVSGGILKRPGLTAALNRLDPGMVFVVASSDRLARDMLVNLTIRHEVARAGATIEFADGSPTTTTPEGELFQNILAAFAQYERSRIRQRTKQGLARKKTNGQRTGTIPIGYQLDPADPEKKRVILHLKEQEAIDRIHHFAKAGLSSARIAAYLTEDFGPCRGNPWSASTIRKIIRRRAS